MHYAKCIRYELHVVVKQAVREGVSKAQQEVAAATSEKAKAEAQIALECYEALQKAIESN